jgi:DNA-binding HxlR family transcriptional regulator
MKQKNPKCPAEATLSVIGGRWKIILLYHLFQGVKRFSELQRAITGVSQKVLTQQLREMERDGVVNREVYPEVPPRVEYSLTLLGDSLRPVIDAMCEWGRVFRDDGLKPETLQPQLAEVSPAPHGQVM